MSIRSNSATTRPPRSSKNLVLPAPNTIASLLKTQTTTTTTSARPVTVSSRPATAPVTSPRSNNNNSQQQRGGSARKPVCSNPAGKRLSVVLPPRRLSSISSSCFESCSNAKVEGANNARVVVSVRKLHFEGYTPHKEFWVRNALEKLGSGWVAGGKISKEQLMSVGFEEKMGTLYDIAMARKHESIDRLVAEVEDEEGVVGKKGKKRSLKAVQEKFPFAPHVSESVKASMSELLLGIMKDEKRDDGDKDRGGGERKSSGKIGDVRKKNKKQTRLKCEEVKKESDSMSSVGSVKRSELLQCFVLDGRLVVGDGELVRVGGSIVNKFWGTDKSRIRTENESQHHRYFRKSANLMGFAPHEVSIRYCGKSHRIVVSGSRPQKGNENARQVREIIALPSGVKAHQLVVMRTCKGSVIFEEQEVEKL